jgi:hypothetical protein
MLLKAFCCFYATSRDFFRLGKLINHRGNWNGQQLVSEAYVNEVCKPAPLLKGNGKPNQLYGFQYWFGEVRYYFLMNQLQIAIGQFFCFYFGLYVLNR